MLSVIQQRTIPDAIRALSGMDRPDYIDLFTVTTNGAADATPEQWFRTALEDVAGRGGQFIWRGVLGLRLKSRPSTERVAGWKIADRGEDWIRLEASSWFLTVHLVTRLDDGQLSAGTFIRYDHPIAPLIWVPASAVHRRMMPGLLVKTVRLRAGHSDGASQGKHQWAANALRKESHIGTVANSTKESVMSRTDNANTRVILEIFSAIEGRDQQRFVELCHSDVEFHWPPVLPYGGTSRGLKTDPPTWGHTWIPLQPTDAERKMDPRSGRGQRRRSGRPLAAAGDHSGRRSSR